MLRFYHVENSHFLFKIHITFCINSRALTRVIMEPVPPMMAVMLIISVIVTRDGWEEIVMLSVSEILLKI